MRVLVTGGAGFIGGHLCQRLLGRGHSVVCVDSFDPFYDSAIKRATVAALARSPRFRLLESDVREVERLEAELSSEGIDAFVHLAARAGVRPSIENPLLYTQMNVEGTTASLELARRLGVKPFVFGSSSSVYGDSAPAPFREDDPVAAPISPYAATKRAGELLCHSFSHLFGLSVVGLRFFTVYGPRQRPDLAIHRFARLMSAGEPIPFFGDGSTRRDYTYVDDIVQGIEGGIAYAVDNPGCFELFNLGESDTVPLSRLVELLSAALGIVPILHRLPAQPGDVQQTFADVSRARAHLGYAPRVRIEEGIPRFVEWFRAQHG